MVLFELRTCDIDICSAEWAYCACGSVCAVCASSATSQGRVHRVQVRRAQCAESIAREGSPRGVADWGLRPPHAECLLHTRATRATQRPSLAQGASSVARHPRQYSFPRPTCPPLLLRHLQQHDIVILVPTSHHCIMSHYVKYIVLLLVLQSAR